jgi:polyisoprenoid-binding protein YceI
MRRNRWLRWLLIGLGVVVLLVAAVPFVYINFIRDDAPEELSLDDVAAESTTTGGPSASTTAAVDAIDGTYNATAGTEAGYRATEILLGQNAEAAGRTTDVAGTVTITGTTIESADFTVQMASVTSGEDRRDNQYRTRIMDVATYPTSTFTLTSPIELTTIPAINEEIIVSATGDLTLRGVTKPVTFDLAAKRTGPDTIAVQGSIPITWSEWNIPEPSFGPAQVAGNGEMEFLLVLAR